MSCPDLDFRTNLINSSRPVVTRARMEENKGIAHIFGLSTVLLGLGFIMSMGVFSAFNPYKPGEKIKCIFTF